MCVGAALLWAGRQAMRVQRSTGHACRWSCQPAALQCTFRCCCSMFTSARHASAHHSATSHLSPTAPALQLRTLSSAASAAGAICDHVRDWLRPGALWRWRRRTVSMGVISDGAYSVPPGIFFSFPVRCGDGAWRVVEVRAGREGARRLAKLGRGKLTGLLEPCNPQNAPRPASAGHSAAPGQLLIGAEI